MSLFKLIVFIFINLTNLYSEDLSRIHFDIDTLSTTTYVQVLVIDPFGRKTGFDYNIGKKIQDIPNSYYGTEIFSDYTTGELVTPKMIKTGINSLNSGKYTLILFALKDTIYELYSEFFDSNGREVPLPIEIYGYIAKNQVKKYIISLDPTPGAPPPVLTKVVTFQSLRDDINVAYKLNQIGDGKFVKSLIKMVNVAEKLSNRCSKPNKKSKPKCYRPSVVILRMISKRLEIVNKLCNSPDQCKPKCKKKECDMDEAFKYFEKKYKKDKELKKFFDDWNKDEWHKHKKRCKKFVTDEALEIISSDINWLIKSFGEEVWKNYKKELNPYIPDKYKNLFK